MVMVYPDDVCQVCLGVGSTIPLIPGDTSYRLCLPCYATYYAYQYSSPTLLPHFDHYTPLTTSAPLASTVVWLTERSRQPGKGVLPL
jgi:hypothetical protein